MSIELDHSFTVPVPPEHAWNVLLDVERVAPCMPGATVDAVNGDEITGRMKIKVGPISMTYTGTARFTERDADARAVTFDASGKETRGAGTAAATVHAALHGEDGQTRVIVHTTLNVTGRPAQFGRGVMAEVGGKLVDRFAANLAELLAGGPGGREASPPQAGTAGGPGGREASPPQAGTAGSGTPAEPAPASSGAGPQMNATRQADLALPIHDLDLSARAHIPLRREGIATLGDLTSRSEQDLLGIANLGPKSVDEIKQKLADRGLALSGSRPSAITSPTIAANGISPPQLQPGGTTPRAPQDPPRPSDDAINLLDVAGVPILKRALPVLGVIAAVLLIARRALRRRRARTAS